MAGPLLPDIAAQLPPGLVSSYWTILTLFSFKNIADMLTWYKNRR